MKNVRLILTIVVVFALATFLGFFIHAIWLKQDYMPIAALYRPEGTEKLVWIFLGYLGFAIGSVIVYAHGVENKPFWIQGVRFGVLMWLILSVPSFLIAYGVQPIPIILTFKQLSSELIAKILLGIVTALVYGRRNLAASL